MISENIKIVLTLIVLAFFVLIGIDAQWKVKVIESAVIVKKEKQIIFTEENVEVNNRTIIFNDSIIKYNIFIKIDNIVYQNKIDEKLYYNVGLSDSLIVEIERSKFFKLIGNSNNIKIKTKI